MTPTKSALSERYSILENSVASVFGLRNDWSSLRIHLAGPQPLRDRAYFIDRGVAADHISSSDTVDIPSIPENAQVICLQFTPDVFKASYTHYLDAMRALRDKPRRGPQVICSECALPGSLDPAAYGECDKSLRQVYLEVLSCLEKSMKAPEYLRLHGELISAVPEEDIEERLVWLSKCPELKSKSKDKDLTRLYLQAGLRLIADAHTLKTLECALIAGDAKEFESILNLVAPKNYRDRLSRKVEKESAGWLNNCPLLAGQLLPDASLPKEIGTRWSELENICGQFLDHRCGKAFNRLPAAMKSSLTGEKSYADEAKVEALAAKPDLSQSFKKFELEANPLSALMGQGSSLNALIEPVSSGSGTHYSLQAYGEHLLPMLAAWQRQRIHVGGSLFRYAYTDASNHLYLGSSITLSEDQELHSYIRQLVEAFDLPAMKKPLQADFALKAIFGFQRHYTRYFDRIRATLKPMDQFILGTLAADDVYVPSQSGSQVSIKSNAERLARREIEKEALRKARIQRVLAWKQAKKSQRQQNMEAAVTPDSAHERVESAEVEVNEQLLEELELKRMGLIQRIEDKAKREIEMAEARRKLKEDQERRKRELEEQLVRRREQEKIEQQKRAEKLVEEKRKREEVRQRRVDSLRSAFVKAQESAQKKQEAKDAQKAEQTKKKKKDINPEAVKMMIRFGTATSAIAARTGLSEDKIEELRKAVNAEDGKSG